MKKVLIFGVFLVMAMAFAQDNATNGQSCQNVVGDAYMKCIYEHFEQMIQEQQAIIESQKQHIQDLQQHCQPFLKDEHESDNRDDWVLVYDNDFQDPLTKMGYFNYSRRTHLRPASGLTAADAEFVLGLLHSDTLIFNLCNLPSHRRIKFSFDLYLLGSIDGIFATGANHNSDSWYLKIDNNPLASELYLGSPDTVKDSSDYILLEGTGFQRRLHGTSTFLDDASWVPNDTISEVSSRHYKVRHDVAHSNPRATLTMAFQLMEGHEKHLNVFNESWAIDNFKVWILED